MERKCSEKAWIEYESDIFTFSIISDAFPRKTSGQIFLTFNAEARQNTANSDRQHVRAGPETGDGS